MATQLAVQSVPGGVKAQGCCTPKEDKTPQKMSVPPKRVLPIIFLPGIMGSNLRMNAARQAELKKDNNIAWRPDRMGEGAPLIYAKPAERQMQLDPSATEVDIFDPENNPTGDKSESAKDRHKLGQIRVSLNPSFASPLLTDDPQGVANRKLKEEKAMERGWGEVYFSSYQDILEHCEQALNFPSVYGYWGRICDADPASFGAAKTPALKAISEKELKEAVAGCWFPVHAMGYNWLNSNWDSAVKISDRIRKLIEKYRSQKYQCEKVILVTHSMGGLVARGVIHPEIGCIAAEVLGIVHGVMPATGAPAAYKRMRCGFEEVAGGLGIVPKVLGNLGPEVTAVLGNAQGGLELLPSKAYGNDWLEIRQNGVVIKSLPKTGDPYSEIYTLQGTWFNLLREEWINPARRPGAGYKRTCSLLRGAAKFHDAIASTYHPTSYAHYGADPARPSWERVVWHLDKNYKGKAWETLKIVSDNGQGRLKVSESESSTVIDVGFSIDGIEAVPASAAGEFSVELGKSSGPGDQTVPLRSADHQRLSGKFSGIFPQSGYEHQGSYSDINAVNSTLFSLSRIISTMKWSDDA